ncbi:ist1 [Anaeramoeba flamelloides]|uniref:Ist1 n=1 Tax=Anaeramoeba flamelloides TaxID=1746091 RepID=A0AAV7YBE9_9EUKA|nr:ist1 [Anaeramoeba flamelloides]
MGKKFKPTESKVTLKLAIKRIHLLQQKKVNQVKNQKRAIATLLSNGKDESARIKVEQVIRDDFLCDAYEMLTLLCDLLLVRFQVLVSEKTCTEDILEAVATIIYVSKKLEVKELTILKSQFVLKYGKEFVLKHLQNKEKVVHEKIVQYLSIMIPEPRLVLQYLEEIAELHDVEWDPEIALPNLVRKVRPKIEPIQTMNFNQGNNQLSQMPMINNSNDLLFQQAMGTTQSLTMNDFNMNQNTMNQMQFQNMNNMNNMNNTNNTNVPMNMNKRKTQDLEFDNLSKRLDDLNKK